MAFGGPGILKISNFRGQLSTLIPERTDTARYTARAL